MIQTMGCRAAATLFFAGLLPAASLAAPLLSEVFYDAAGSDNGLSFVELWGVPGTSLVGVTLEGVNGSNGAITPNITLSGVIGVDGLFVVADDAGDGTTGVAGADLILNFDFQNGPDSIVLRGAGGSVLDALGYGVFGAGKSSPGRGTRRPMRPPIRHWPGSSPTSTRATTSRTSRSPRLRPVSRRSCPFPSPPACSSWRGACWGSRAWGAASSCLSDGGTHPP